MNNLQQKLKNLTTRPGIYQMLNSTGQVLYVGKAKNLKKRVASYFRKNLSGAKVQSLMTQVVDFKVTLTENENEALLLEANLIKKLHPRYNILLRDDKSYPYLYLSNYQEFPRLDFYRGAKTKKGRYFGPYPDAGSVRDNLAFIQKLFRLRQCSDTFFAHRTRPCLQYQIQRCTAPCVGKVNREQYAEQVMHAVLFLEGKNQTIINDLIIKMEQASIRLEYELAAHYRNQIAKLRKFQTKQFVVNDRGNIDILAVAMRQNKAVVDILFIRAGRLIGNRHFYPKIPATTDEESILTEFIPQYYLSPMRGDTMIDRIVIEVKLTDRLWIQEALQQQLQHDIQITDRKIERYRHWQNLANRNAQFALTQLLLQQESYAEKLHDLQIALDLPNPLAQVECFDVSHTMGEETVASCVVFNREGPATKEYRRFNIKNIEPGDDYAAMRQVIKRRYTRVKEEGLTLPDLIMVDGGKGQLQCACDILEELQVSGVQVLAIAKGPARKPGEEQLLLPHHAPFMLPPHSHALHVIQFIRDEAHRFAITAHRAKRHKKSGHSVLEDIEGVGAKRRRELLRHFGGLQQLQQASITDIAKVSGVSAALAKRIYDALHEET